MSDACDLLLESMKGVRDLLDILSAELLLARPRHVPPLPPTTPRPSTTPRPPSSSASSPRTPHAGARATTPRAPQTPRSPGSGSRPGTSATATTPRTPSSPSRWASGAGGEAGGKGVGKGRQGPRDITVPGLVRAHEELRETVRSLEPELLSTAKGKIALRGARAMLMDVSEHITRLKTLSALPPSFFTARKEVLSFVQALLGYSARQFPSLEQLVLLWKGRVADKHASFLGEGRAFLRLDHVRQYMLAFSIIESSFVEAGEFASFNLPAVFASLPHAYRPDHLKELAPVPVGPMRRRGSLGKVVSDQQVSLTTQRHRSVFPLGAPLNSVEAQAEISALRPVMREDEGQHYLLGPAVHFRNVRIFVSSTFTDTVSERERLNSEVVPTVNAMMSRRGIRVSLVELRWGLDAEPTAWAQEVSYREIDRCRDGALNLPWMIILRTERYGHVPLGYPHPRDCQGPLAYLSWLDALREDAAKIPTAILSLPSLECIHGALCVPDQPGYDPADPEAPPVQCFAYFRDPSFITSVPEHSQWIFEFDYTPLSAPIVPSLEDRYTRTPHAHQYLVNKKAIDKALRAKWQRVKCTDYTCEPDFEALASAESATAVTVGLAVDDKAAFPDRVNDGVSGIISDDDGGDDQDANAHAGDGPRSSPRRSRPRPRVPPLPGIRHATFDDDHSLDDALHPAMEVTGMLGCEGRVAGLDNFVDAVIDDLSSALLRAYPVEEVVASRSSMSTDSAHLSYLEDLAASHRGREDEVAQLLAFANGAIPAEATARALAEAAAKADAEALAQATGSWVGGRRHGAVLDGRAPIDPASVVPVHGPYLIMGPRGSGKSSLLAKVAKEALNTSASEVFIHFARPCSDITPLDLLRRLRQWLLALLDRSEVETEASGGAKPTPFALQDVVGSVRQLLQEACASRTVVLILDALETLAGQEGVTGWLPSPFPRSLRIIAGLTVSDGDEDGALLSSSIFPAHPLWRPAIFRMPPLMAADGAVIVRELLAPFGIFLTEDTRDVSRGNEMAFLLGLPVYLSPAYLFAACQTVGTEGRYNGRSASKTLRKMPRTQEELYDAVLDMLELNHGTDLVRYTMLTFLACPMGMYEHVLLGGIERTAAAAQAAASARRSRRILSNGPVLLADLRPYTRCLCDGRLVLSQGALYEAAAERYSAATEIARAVTPRAVLHGKRSASQLSNRPSSSGGGGGRGGSRFEGDDGDATSSDDAADLVALDAPPADPAQADKNARAFVGRGRSLWDVLCLPPSDLVRHPRWKVTDGAAHSALAAGLLAEADPSGNGMWLGVDMAVFPALVRQLVLSAGAPPVILSDIRFLEALLSVSGSDPWAALACFARAASVISEEARASSIAPFEKLVLGAAPLIAGGFGLGAPVLQAALNSPEDSVCFEQARSIELSLKIMSGLHSSTSAPSIHSSTASLKANPTAVAVERAFPSMQSSRLLVSPAMGRRKAPPQALMSLDLSETAGSSSIMGASGASGGAGGAAASGGSGSGVGETLESLLYDETEIAMHHPRPLGVVEHLNKAPDAYLKRTVPSGIEGACSLAVNPTGTHMVLASPSEVAVFVLTPSSSSCVVRLPIAGGVLDVAISHRGDLILVAQGSGPVVAISTVTSAVVATIPFGPGVSALRLRFCGPKAGGSVASALLGLSNGTLTLLGVRGFGDTASVTVESSIKPPIFVGADGAPRKVKVVHCDLHGSSIAVYLETDTVVKLLATAGPSASSSSSSSSSTLKKWRVDPDTVEAVSFMRGGLWIAIACLGTLEVFEVVSGAKLSSLSVLMSAFRLSCGISAFSSSVLLSALGEVRVALVGPDTLTSAWVRTLAVALPHSGEPKALALLDDVNQGVVLRENGTIEIFSVPKPGSLAADASAQVSKPTAAADLWLRALEDSGSANVIAEFGPRMDAWAGPGVLCCALPNDQVIVVSPDGKRNVQGQPSGRLSLVPLPLGSVLTDGYRPRTMKKRQPTSIEAVPLGFRGSLRTASNRRGLPQSVLCLGEPAGSSHLGLCLAHVRDVGELGKLSQHNLGRIGAVACVSFSTDAVMIGPKFNGALEVLHNVNVGTTNVVLETPEEVGVGGFGRVASIVFSPDENSVTYVADGHVLRNGTHSGALTLFVPSKEAGGGPTDYFTCSYGASQRGKVIACTASGSIHLISGAGKVLFSEIKAHKSSILSCWFDRASSVLFTGDEMGLFRSWAVDSDKEQRFILVSTFQASGAIVDMLPCSLSSSSMGGTSGGGGGGGGGGAGGGGGSGGVMNSSSRRLSSMAAVPSSTTLALLTEAPLHWKAGHQHPPPHHHPSKNPHQQPHGGKKGSAAASSGVGTGGGTGGMGHKQGSLAKTSSSSLTSSVAMLLGDPDRPVLSDYQIVSVKHVPHLTSPGSDWLLFEPILQSESLSKRQQAKAKNSKTTLVARKRANSRERHQAAIDIQRTYRGYRTRKVVVVRRPESIQTIAGYTGSHRVSTFGHGRRTAQYLDQEIRVAAAIEIQRVYRGHATRKTLSAAGIRVKKPVLIAQN